MMEIYFVAVSVLGFILGVGVMAFLDNKNLKDLMEWIQKKVKKK